MTVPTTLERRVNGPRMTLAAAIGAALLTACGEVQEPAMEVEVKTARVTEADVATAWQAVKAVCPRLFERHLSDVAAISARAQDAYADYRLAKGWLWEVQFSVRLDAELRTFPADVRTMPTLATFFVNTSSDGVPGVFIKLRPAHVACGLDLSPAGADTFIQVPAQ